MAPAAVIIKQRNGLSIYANTPATDKFISIESLASLLRSTVTVLRPRIVAAPNTPITLLTVTNAVGTAVDIEFISESKLPGLLSFVSKAPTALGLSLLSTQLLQALAKVQFSLISFTENFTGTVVGTIQGGGTSGGNGGGGTTVSSGSSLPVSVPFSNSPPLNQTVTISATAVSSPIAFIAPSGAVAGSTSYARMVADGNLSNTPTFAGFSQLLGSSGWDNRAGIANLVQFFYDGVTYFYSIAQAVGAQPIDTTAPTIVSALLNVAKDKITITYSEPISGAITPAQYTLTGATISATTIVSSTVELTLNPAAAGGTTLTLAYTGNTIRDSANNPAATFTGTNIPNAATATSIPFTLASTLLETSAGTYQKSSGAAGTWVHVATSNTAIFTGAKTYEANLSSSSTMIWIDSTGDLADYTTGDYGFFWQQGTTIRNITAGALTSPTTPVVTSGPVRLRIRRTAANNLSGFYSLDSGVTWVLAIDWGTVTGDFFLKFASNNGIISEISCA